MLGRARLASQGIDPTDGTGSAILNGQSARTSAATGSSCRKSQPILLPTALLKGPRRAVGSPIIGIQVNADFQLQGSQARYLDLHNEIDEGTYSRLADAVKSAVVSDIKARTFRFNPDDSRGPLLRQDPAPEQIQMKMDFGASLLVRGLTDAFVFIETSQVSATSRRRLRLADGKELTGKGVEMPDTILLPLSQWAYIMSTPRSQYSNFTIGQYFLENSVSIKSIEALNELQQVAPLPSILRAGSGNLATAKDIMVVYKKDPRRPFKDLDKKFKHLVFYGSHDEIWGRPFEGVVKYLQRLFRETDSDWLKEEIASFMYESPCPECQGRRLKKESLAVKVAECDIAQLTALSIKEAKQFFSH